MSHLISLEVVIAAPIERVYAAQIDFDRWSEWMPGLIKLERLNDKPFGPGFRWREVRRVMGRDASEVFEVTALEPERMMTLKVDGKDGSMGRGLMTFRYDFVPKGALTQLALLSEIDGLGWFGDLMFRLFGGSFKKAVARDLHAFKAYLEVPRDPLEGMRGA